MAGLEMAAAGSPKQRAVSSGASVRFSYEFKSALGLAWDSIRQHKLRSFLTLLGVIIGVASVILVGSAIDGMGIYAEESTAKAFGSESFMVAQVASVGNMTRRQYFDKLRYNRPIKLEEERYLEMANGEHTLWAGYRQNQVTAKRDALVSEETSVIGTSADLVDIRDIVVVSGRFFTPLEEQSATPVAVIGDDL